LDDLVADLEASKDLRDLPVERSNSAKFLINTNNARTINRTGNTL
jgi:hypothetical protein